MNSNPFVFNVGDLGSNHVATKPVRIEAAPGWHVELSRVADDRPVTFDGELTMTSGGLVVRGALLGTAIHTCTRCLARWDEAVMVEVAQLVAGVDVADPEDEDYVYSGNDVDLEPVLRDEFLLALPMLPSCPDGCEQLVEVSSNDLNTPAPNDTGESVSPFAVLKDLLDHEL
jgi:uncharacterized protein